MQIDPKNNASLPSLLPTRPPQPESAASDQAKGVVDTTVFVPTATLASLLAQVHQLPETRDDLVRQVRDRLAKGDLLSSRASAETAQAILGTETTGQ